MRRIFYSFWVVALCLGSLSFGCAGQNLRPLADEVLVYPLPFDLAYLRTLEAVQSHPDWDLNRTLKEEGIIEIRNVRYSSFADADQRSATLILKRVGPRRTSIQFAPKSQTVVGTDDVLALVKQYLSREASKT